MISPTKRDRLRSIYGISRIDDEKTRTHCWIVCIQRRQKIWRRSFADGVFGGKTNALRSARAYRDELVASYLPMMRSEYAAIRRRNNRSGVPGVCRYAASKIVSGEPVERAYWIAFWMMPNGKPSSRRFSVAKYGEAAAFKRAKAIRREALAALNTPFVNSSGLKNWLRRHSPQ